MDLSKIEGTVKLSRWFMSLLVITTIAFYGFWFGIEQDQPLSTDSTFWGTFGDFVGGLLNPIIAFSAFWWLTVSVLVQKEELADAKEALGASAEAQKAQVEQMKTAARLTANSEQLKALESNITFKQKEIAHMADACSGYGQKGTITDFLGNKQNVSGAIERIGSLDEELGLMLKDRHKLIESANKMANEAPKD